MLRRLVLLFAIAIPAMAVHAQSGPPVRIGALPPLFPPDNWWNQDISAAPVDPRSAQLISFVGTTRRLHPDFGGYESPGSVNIYGFPYVTVPGDQPKRAVQFYYSAESDGVDHATGRSVPFYPIPDEAIAQPYFIEGGPAGNTRPGGDRHMLIVDRDNRILYELFDLAWNGSQWTAGSGAAFDLKVTARRPDTWTSADAAGLAILPGLIRYDEAAGPDEIRHAFRVTVRATNGYVWPASHSAGSNAAALPMGARLRLKPSTDLSRFHPGIQKIFRAMQRYGLIVADNGSDMYISGTFDPRWPNDILNPAFGALTANDFDVIELGWRGTTTAVPCTPIGTPAPFNVTVSGRFVVLTWAGVAGATDYLVEVGSSSGASDLLVAPVGNVTSVSTFADPRTYYARVRGRNGCGVSGPSNEVVVRIS
ncbi:MAG TPA: hypothetical protein VKD69_10675 [Vicinamibacterales bacterium]|nr:hypothetical protein [Vicinamibacterales bacterium]